MLCLFFNACQSVQQMRLGFILIVTLVVLSQEPSQISILFQTQEQVRIQLVEL